MATQTMPVAPTSCPTHKKPFSTYEEARLWEEQNRAKYPTNPQQYAYACEECSSYHLSSMQPGYHNQTSSSQLLGKLSNADAPRRKPSGNAVEHKEEIKRLRSVERWTIRRIADHFDVSTTTIMYHLRDGDLSRRSGEKRSRVSVIPGDLSTIEQRKADLREQLAKLEAEEERIREYKRVKVESWEGKGGLVISKEGNKLFLTDEDANLLMGRLTAFLMVRTEEQPQ